MEAMGSFEEWKEFLSKNVQVAARSGASPERIVDVATRIGGFLADKVDPANREQRLLKELWQAADDQERHSLATIVTKMVSDGFRH